MNALTEAPARPPAGWRAVARKEIADHLRSARLLVVAALLALTGIAAVYAAGGRIRDVAAQASDDPSLFLKLFTVAIENTPFAFVNFVALIGPLLGIAFGFDAISSERAQRTLPRLLAQPIHRDDVVNGKFVAGLAVIGMLLTALMAIVAAVGMVRLGVVPRAEDIGRLLVYLLVSIVYIGVWLAFALMLSILLQRAATAALTAIGAWLVLSLLAGLLVQIAAGLLAEPGSVAEAELQQALGRASPALVYEEVTAALLTPELRTLGVILPEQTFRAVPTQLPLGESMLLVWPQMAGLVALTVVLFAVAYVSFLRQEVRV
ncbi:ABC-2 type transport system permease protein [Thermocatellispora tengchongensis]|uniref:ABC-2 type transport system permease protein n=1 Tax=Thermocatellispora tengchongensis TaxID=1073253 RepID=A0A840PN89_9ACTN|nr:ABC transporter permease subunit [Thermocatellispora tengchongensis]MBB5139251.1 ABC-2 type transport system permease protein [Thermocatellispora tengchongensis]